MSPSRYPHGLSSFGIPVLGSGTLTTTGNIWFVSSTTGSDGNTGDSSDCPFATLDYAIGKCTASQGDIIILMPSHAETTTAVAVDVAGIKITGLGVGRTRPTLTATTAASDLLDVTVANVQIENIRLVGAASGCTGLIHLAAAADFTCIGCSLEHGAAPVSAVSCTGLNPRFNFKDCIFMGTAAGPDYGINMSGSVSQCHNFTVENCTFNYGTSAGLDNAGIFSAKTNTGVTIRNCRFISMDLTAIDFNSSSTGLLEAISGLSTNATVAEMIDAGLCGFVDCRLAYAGTSGARIPATTATP
jgi:hypothetical protein